jgi:hypothetical protein
VLATTRHGRDVKSLAEQKYPDFPIFTPFHLPSLALPKPPHTSIQNHMPPHSFVPIRVHSWFKTPPSIRGKPSPIRAQALLSKAGGSRSTISASGTADFHRFLPITTLEFPSGEDHL